MRRLLILVSIVSVLLLAASAAPAAGAAWVWPVSGEVITSYRNGSDPYATGQHRGIDIAASVGSAVRAAAAGDVRFAGGAGSSGLTISIRTGDGYDTSYLHLSSLEVRAGQHVSAGDRIGAVGTTGARSATAPHLHFGVRNAGTRHAYHDPLAFLPPAPPAAPAPEPPSPLPAPGPEPTPPPPTPAPLPVGAPQPTRAPKPHRFPLATRAPEPHARPLATPAPKPHAFPLSTRPRTPRAFPLSTRPRTPRALPLATRAPQPHAPPRPLHAPGRFRAPRAIPRAVGAPPSARSTPPARSAVPAEAPEPSSDIGWVLACAGLLLAAAVLGLTEDGRRAGTRTRSMLRAHFARARAARG